MQPEYDHKPFLVKTIEPSQFIETNLICADNDKRECHTASNSFEGSLEIKVQEFYCPIRSAASPHMQNSDEQVVHWMSQFEIFENPIQREYFAKSHFPAFPGFSLSEACSHLLPLPGKEVLWLQSFDDVHSDERAVQIPLGEYILLLGNLTRVIEDPRCGLLADNRWANALRDLRLEIEQHATHVQVDRWVQANIEYFNGLLWEAANRSKNKVPALNEYVAMWLKQSGVYPCIVFTDIACGYELAPHHWSHPKVRTLREMVAAIIGWDNDLTSYNKEVHRSQSRHFPAIQNLVSVIAHERSCSAAQATTLAHAMRNRAMYLFLELRDELTAIDEKELCRYVDGLGQWIRGYLDYSGRSPRYRDFLSRDDAAAEDNRFSGWKLTEIVPPPVSNLPDISSVLSWWR